MKFSKIIDLYESKKASLSPSLRSEKSPPLGYIINAYNKTIETLKTVENVEITKDNLINLNLTDHTKKAIWDYFKNPTPIPTKADLTKLSGIGNKKAQKLNEIGIQNQDELKSNQQVYNKLSDEIKNSINYEIIEKIPNEHIKKIETTIKNSSDYDFVICGSYRREKPFSSDIDLILIGRSDKDIDKFIDDLETDYKCVINSKGESKASVLIKPFKTKPFFYKMDIFLTSKKLAPAMILYATGSKENNIRMRATAKKMGMMLNQMGLHDSEGKLMNIKTEQDFYKKLNLPYLEPNKR